MAKTSSQLRAENRKLRMVIATLRREKAEAWDAWRAKRSLCTEYAEALSRIRRAHPDAIATWPQAWKAQP